MSYFYPQISSRPITLLAISRLVRILSFIIYLYGASGLAWGQETQDKLKKPDLPVDLSSLTPSSEAILFSADEIEYDKVLDQITTIGNVEIIRGNRKIQADRIVITRDQVSATGNVILTDQAGNTTFASHVDLTQDLGEGVIRDLRARLQDESRMTAHSAFRKNGQVTVMRRGVYTPCKSCAEDPQADPFWQITARKIRHNQKTRKIIFYDAFMELFGVPILYIPYLSQPDPSVERQSGFLMPRFGNSKDLGFLLYMSYYYNISKDFDVTFKPIFMTKKGIIGGVQIRKHFAKGKITADGSIGFLDRKRGNQTIKKDDLRGHIKIESEYHISKKLRARGQFHRTTDTSYLQKFGFESGEHLDSFGLIEGFIDDNYAAVEVRGYQGLSDNDKKGDEPLIAPRAFFQHISKPDKYGGILTLEGSTLAITRTNGLDSRRLSLGGAWRLPLHPGGGQLLDLTVSLQADGYHVADAAENNKTRNGWAGRVHPQAALVWRYPWVRHEAQNTTLIEPILSLIASPDFMKQDRFPNEDSRYFELDDTNILSINRSTGLDRVETGQRIAGGINILHTGHNYSADLFIGQSYRLQSNAGLTGEGTEDQMSDLVGRLDLDFSEYANILYRFRLDKENFSARHQYIKSTFGVPAFSVSGTYLYNESETITGSHTRAEELVLEANSVLNDNWSANLSWRQDLLAKKARSIGAGFSYSNDCITIDTKIIRTYFKSKELNPDNSITFRISLKNIGEFGG